MKNKFTFETSPSIHKRRSSFDLSHSQTTTGTVGRLQPFLVQEVYPGDTFTIDETSVVKVASNFIKPPTGNINFERYYFFVPNRLVYDKWENVVANSDDPDGWEQTSRDNVPTCYVGGIVEKSIADFMRIPVFAQGNSKLKVNELPFRAFALIYNQWFRNQNVQDNVVVPKSYTTTNALNDDDWDVNNIFGMCPHINKYKDVFTTCLPAPQKGSPIQVPLFIPQTTLDTVQTNDTTLRPGTYSYPLDFKWGTSQGIEVKPDNNEAYIPMQVGNDESIVRNNQSIPRNFTLIENSETDGTVFIGGGEVALPSYGSLGDYNIIGTNLVTKQQAISGFTIDDMYKAMALQRASYIEGLGGSRYIEILRSIWAVDSPDARLQRSELLYGDITSLDFQQVAQTTGSDEKTLANLSAYSNTLAKTKLYKGFVEHGFIIGVCTFRQKHLYQQGVERFWLRERSEDYYNPLFANWGEQNVHRAELYAQNTHNEDDELIPFGYQEAWYDLRYRPSAITGETNSYADNTLDIWHFGDKYSNAPVLSSQFMEEVPTFVDRGLAVPSTTQDQFIIDTRFNIQAIRRLPVRSIPGVQSVY